LCFPTEAKIFPETVRPRKKKGIFVCPQTTQLFEDKQLNPKLNSTARRAWDYFEETSRNFLGNDIVEK
jgi:hypothetical protein